MRAAVWLFFVCVCVCACGAHASYGSGSGASGGSKSKDSSPSEKSVRGFEPLVDRELWRDNFYKNAHIFGVASLYKDIYKQIKNMFMAIPSIVRKKHISLSADPMILLSRAWAYSFLHQILAGSDMPPAWRDHATKVFVSSEANSDFKSQDVTTLGRVATINPASVSEYMDQFVSFAYFFLKTYSHNRLGICSRLPATHFDGCISSLIPGLQTSLYQSVIMFLEYSLLDQPRAVMRENLYVAIVGSRCPLSSLFSPDYLHVALNVGPVSHLHSIVRNSQEVVPAKRAILKRGANFRRLMQALMSRSGVSVASMMQRLSKEVEMLYVPRDQLISDEEKEADKRSRQQVIVDAKTEHDQLVEDFTSRIGPLEESIQEEQSRLQEIYGDDSVATQIGLLKRVMDTSVLANAVPFLNASSKATQDEEKRGVLNKMRGLELGDAVADVDEPEEE